MCRPIRRMVWPLIYRVGIGSLHWAATEADRLGIGVVVRLWQEDRVGDIGREVVPGARAPGAVGRVVPGELAGLRAVPRNPRRTINRRRKPASRFKV